VQQNGSPHNIPVLNSTKRMGYSAPVNVGFNNELGATLTISVIDMMMRAAMEGCGGGLQLHKGK
jgi:hypothetical protein